MGRTRRRVYFDEAARRILKQPWRLRIRSLVAVAQAAFDSFSFALRLLPALPAQIHALRTRVAREGYNLHGSDCPGPLVVYVHGGAWGSGSAGSYAAVGAAISRACDSPVAVADQRVWPMASMVVQAADVAKVVRQAREEYEGRPCVLVAHSSGAHSAALALALPPSEGCIVNAAVLQAGVYDPLMHYSHEAVRGVESVSPMAPAAEADMDVLRLHDFVVSKSFCSAKVATSVGDAVRVGALEGDAHATWFGSSVPLDKKRTAYLGVPQGGIYLMAATEDAVVPLTQTMAFKGALAARGIDARLLLYTQTEHTSFPSAWVRHVCNEGTLDIEPRDGQRRAMAFRTTFGAALGILKEKTLDRVPNTPHARDLMRIVDAHRSLTRTK